MPGRRNQVVFEDRKFLAGSRNSDSLVWGAHSASSAEKGARQLEA